MDTKIIEVKSDWEGFLILHPEANFLQSWLWGEFQKSLDKKIFRTGIYDGYNLKGIFFSYIETSKRGRFLVVPGGPILDWGKDAQIKLFADRIKQIAKENGCIFIRVRPQLLDDEKSGDIFAKMGFTKAPMYLHAELTSQLDITKTEEELLVNMRKTTRYEIKKAKNTGIKVTFEYNNKTQDEFIRLQDETAKRQKFVPFSRKFLTNQFKIFIENDIARLYTATFEDKLLAQAFIIFYGDEAVYHYGASTEAGRHYPGAYLIQWEAILEAKKRGLKRYNFWGVSPLDSKDHRFAGLSLFKRGFAGVDVAYLPARDLVISKAKYKINYIIEKIRRKARNV